ncbi:MAG: hypothetical protein ACLSDQ_00380 [Adlercreutzia equolifaciens]
MTDEGSDSFDLLAPYTRRCAALCGAVACPPAVPPMRRAQHGGPFAARQGALMDNVVLVTFEDEGRPTRSSTA